MFSPFVGLILSLPVAISQQAVVNLKVDACSADAVTRIIPMAGNRSLLSPSTAVKCGSQMFISPVLVNGSARTTANLRVGCSPRPGMVMIVSDNTVGVGGHLPSANCAKFFFCKPDVKEGKMCSNIVSRSTSAKELAFTNDINCIDDVINVKNAGGVVAWMYPRWQTSKALIPNAYRQPVFNLQSKYYKGRNTHNIRYDLATFGVPTNIALSQNGKLLGGPTPTALNNCGGGCDAGSVISLTFTPQHRFEVQVHVNKLCTSMKMCIDGLIDARGQLSCTQNHMLTVLISAGFVILPNEYEARALQIATPTKEAVTDEENFYVFKIFYGVPNSSQLRWMVSNVFDEYVLGTEHLKNAGRMFFVFSDPKCLRKDYGLASKQIKEGTAFNLGQGQTVTYASPEGAIGEAVVDTQASTAPPPLTTTMEVSVPPTTTQRPMGYVLAMTKIETAPFMAGGWMTWAFFFGYIAGLLLTSLIGGLVVYMFRRSFYNTWYRGMYKRYKCDASGVTGGVTGASFGATTTGFTSAGTTAGTTGGTTGATTSGTTGGGDTTASSTSGKTTTDVTNTNITM